MKNEECWIYIDPDPRLESVNNWVLAAGETWAKWEIFINL